MTCLAVLLAFSCGGPSAAVFVGDWNGAGTITIAPKVMGGSELTINLPDEKMTLLEDLNSGDVRFSECNWRGVVKGTQLELRQNLAHCLVVNSSPTSCAVTLTLFSGIVSARGNSLSLDYGGEAVLSSCPDNSFSGAGTYTAHFDGYRK